MFHRRRTFTEYPPSSPRGAYAAIQQFRIAMKFPPLTVIDIQHEATAQMAGYANLPLCLVNDHVVRMSVMTEPFYWYLHPNSDEVFLVMEGGLYIDFETHTLELGTGQLVVIPKNVKHRTRPVGARSVNLTFESEALETTRLPA